jgi:hypothetical protein
LTANKPNRISGREQAMDFFHGLDQAKYGTFKTNMLNRWATGAIKLPETVNEIYWIAGRWVKLGHQNKMESSNRKGNSNRVRDRESAPQFKVQITVGNLEIAYKMYGEHPEHV